MPDDAATPADEELTRDMILDTVRVVVAGAAEDMKHSVEIVRIVGALLRLSWRELGEQEHEALVAQVDRQSSHVGHLADRLLQVARLEPAAYGARPEVIDLNAYLLARCSDLMLEPPEILLSCPPKARVLADCDHVWQIVQLLIDAMLVLVAPPVEVTISVEDEWVLFRFGGVPTADDALVARLFEPVNDPAAGPASVPHLWFPRQLARANGGDVWCDLAPRQSAILLRLPAALR